MASEESGGRDQQPTLLDHLYDPKHPRKSPVLGRFLSRSLCRLGHSVVEMELDSWDEPWLACSVCGARFFPAEAISDETDVVYI